MKAISLTYIKVAYLILMILPACQSGKEAHFTTDELSWLHYNIGDTIWFKGSDDGKMALTVKYKTEPSQVGDHYPIEAELTLVDLNGKEWFNIYLLKDRKLFKKYFLLSNVYRNLDLINPIDNINIGNKIYNNVYVIKEDTTKSNVLIEQVYFTRQDGIIKFDKKDNVTYHLIPKDSL